jgi:hypothetical protein
VLICGSAGRRRHRARPAALAALLVAAALILVAATPAGAASRPHATHPAKDVPRIIIDTDLSRWWDDVTALGEANVLMQRGQVRILGIVSDVPNREAVAAIDAIDTAYGHGDIPVGAVAGSGHDTFVHGYTDVLAKRLPHRVHGSQDAPPAVALYRSLLTREHDHSVTLVSLGGYTNLAGLLRSKHGNGSNLGGRALVAKKAKRLVVMDGLFPTGGPAFTNQKIDLASAREVVGGAGWPTPIAWVDGLDGIQTQVGGSLCTTVPPKNPMRIVYEKLFGCGPPKDGDWDGPTLLYAVGDGRGDFSELGRGGAAVLNSQGGLSWEPSTLRTHDVYVHVADQPALNQRIDALLAAR